MEDENQDFESLEELEDIGGEEGDLDEIDEMSGGGKGGGKVDTKSLDLILDIPLTVAVELGRSKILINDLLQLGQGSVIELTKLVGEPLEVLVNNKLVARGEVVVVNEKFGVRLTDIVTPMERVQFLT
jgi:flagellar motor switch protein FliN/FliY